MITPEWIEKYLGSIDAQNDWYSDDSPFGGPIAPSAVFNYEMMMFGGWHPVGATSILNSSQTWEFRRPLRPGQRIQVEGVVLDRYLKRGREYVAMQSTARDEDGNLLCRTVTTDSWYAPDDAQGESETREE